MEVMAQGSMAAVGCGGARHQLVPACTFWILEGLYGYIITIFCNVERKGSCDQRMDERVWGNAINDNFQVDRTPCILYHQIIFKMCGVIFS